VVKTGGITRRQSINVNVQSGPPCDKPNSCGPSGEESHTKERRAVGT